MKFATRVMLAAALSCACVSQAAVTTSTHTTYQVRRGSTNVPPAPTNEDECIRRAHETAAEDGKTRESGGNDFQCHKVLHVLAVFRPNPPPPVCPEKPADEQQPQTCPAGTVGTWLQDRIWTLQPAPTCWVLGEWTPAEPPAGMCAPIDSDADGVPDSRDQCPTVHASTPDGCPATPPANRAPTISGSLGHGTVGVDYFFRPTASDPEGGALTFSISGAPSWMVFRTLDGRITGRPTVAATHSNIVISVRDSAGLTASLPPATVTVTGGSAPVPVDCVVSAWSAWTGGSWSTCSNGQQSRSETRTRTVATPAANGGAACPALTETRTMTQACSSDGDGGIPPASGTAPLSWTPPTHYSNGDRLTDIRNYQIVFGQSQGGLSDCTASITCRTIEAPAGSGSSFTVTGLSPGTWYFAVRTVAASGTESVNSNVVSKTVQ